MLILYTFDCSICISSLLTEASFDCSICISSLLTEASFVCSQPKVPEGATVSLSNDPPDCGSIAFLTCPSDALPSFSPDQCIRKPGTLDGTVYLITNAMNTCIHI